jgi:hypothetical protein
MQTTHRLCTHRVRAFEGKSLIILGNITLQSAQQNQSLSIAAVSYAHLLSPCSRVTCFWPSNRLELVS